MAKAYEKLRIKYVVDKINKTVTAYAFVQPSNIDISILALISDERDFIKYFGLPIEATARCKDEDVFDIQIGMRVARRKLVKNLVRIQLQIVNDAQDAMTLAHKMLSEESERLSNTYMRCIEKLREF